MVFKCSSCDSKFTRKSNLRSHFTLRHAGPKHVVSCFLCGCVYNNTDLLEKHHKDIHSPSKYFHLKESAFKKTAADCAHCTSLLPYQNFVRKQSCLQFSMFHSVPK